MIKLSLKYQHLMFYFFLVLSVFIPLYPKFPLSSVAGTYVAIRLEDILIFLILLIWAFLNLTNIKKILSQTITQVIILFWVVGLVSLISGVYLTKTVDLSLGLLHFLRRIEYMSVFFVAATTIKNLHQVKLFSYAMFISTIIIVIYGFGQVYSSFPVISTTNREFSKGLILSLTPGARPNSTFGGHYDLAAYLAMVLVFFGTLFFYYKKLKEKALIILTALPSFGLLGLTAARMSFAATLAGLVISFWMMGKRLLVILLIIASVLVVFAVPQLRHRLVATVTVNLLGGGGPKYQPDENVVNDFTPRVPGASESAIPEATAEATASSGPKAPADIAPGEPIDSTELGVFRSFNIRTNVEWPRAIRAFEKNPVLGTGYSSINIATDNDFLRSLGETGLLGTLSFALIFLVIIKKLLKNFKKKDRFEKLFIISTFCAVLTIVLTGTFIDILEASKIATLLWLLLGVSWAISNNYSEGKS